MEESKNNIGNPYAFLEGKNVIIRTVTMAVVGRLMSVHPQELVLEDAAWVADTGKRWYDFLRFGGGTSQEVEPFPDGCVVVGRGAIVDCCEWAQQLLREQV